MIGVLLFTAVLLVGIVIVVLGTRSRLRAGPRQGFQGFNLALLTGVALIVGSIIGISRVH